MCLAYSCRVIGLWYVYNMCAKILVNAFNPFMEIRIFNSQDPPTSYGAYTALYTPGLL